MSSSAQSGSVGSVEADHRIANNLASLSAAIRLQRSSITKNRKPFTAEQVCTLLDEIDARIEVAAKLHQCLARAGSGSGIHLGDFLRQKANQHDL